MNDYLYVIERLVSTAYFYSVKTYFALTMNRGQVDLKQITGAALTVVVALGAFLFFQLTNFNSINSFTDNFTRFIWAITHTIAPTSGFDILLEVIVAGLGFVTINRIDARIALFVSFILLFGTSFTLAWFAAPV
jgi:hypothetical protein